ncbi:MCE family protein [Nocardioides sp. Root151]|uniref:MCE family protein n=1 Tax=Nocardioides sp. Root151 TaxID=1736475 RepID=UPI00070257BF|nr:MCE family protein [Nocardioides sp. Root151]KQZ75430.1 hypothetical protein ASD66_03470 [Nocardioides sp. Root151]
MKRLALGSLAASSVLLFAGCSGISRGAYDMPLPGGADVGDDPIKISADFEDALDLVPQSSVKVDNVAVGRVSEITLNDDGHSAHVELVVNSDVDLPAGTQARLSQTSLLGEKYVALVRPAASTSGPSGSLSDGDNLGLAATSQAAEVEQVLGALSMVLNGGGIDKFQQISRELQKISTGRPGEIKAFLGQMQTFVTGLDDRKESITAAIDGLARLSETLDGDKEKITNALNELSPGMQVIVDQRKQLVAMLSSLDTLSNVTVETLNAAQDDIVADLQSLEPILAQLAKSGSDLPESLQMLLTYPFPDSVLGAIKGDFLNVFITTNFRTLPAGCDAIGCVWPQVSGTAPATRTSPGLNTNAPPTLLEPTNSPAPGIPTPTMTVPTPSADPTDPSTDPSPSSDPSSSDPTTSSDPSPSDPSPSDPTDSSSPQADSSLAPREGDQ